ncbi:MAG: hypothetical protein IPK76_27125 [Lewinellaceae bacterium]|nr:hypothetical protein [Lewinellaceae bacterium]
MTCLRCSASHTSTLGEGAFPGRSGTDTVKPVPDLFALRFEKEAGLFFHI